MATLCTAVESNQEFNNSSVVKVVLDHDGRALYFSRGPIPWTRSDGDSALQADAWRGGLRHLGIYAYRCGYIRKFSARGPSPLESRERLEQLRALWHGESIACALPRGHPASGYRYPRRSCSGAPETMPLKVQIKAVMRGPT